MLTCAVHVSDIWKWRTNAQSVRARARKHGRDPRWARREGRHQLVAAVFRPGCQRVSATCGGLPATHQLAHYKSSQKCHLNQWPFGNNATRQNSICKTTGLFYVHGFFLFFFTFALHVFFSQRMFLSSLAEHGITWKMFNLSCLTQTIRFSCASSCAWRSFWYFLVLHAARFT